jgi:Cytosine/adenosine deaminases
MKFKKVVSLIKWVGLFSLVYILSGCDRSTIQNKLDLPFQKYSIEGDTIQQELDEIYSLLAFSLVHKDWQPDSLPRNKRRGYNIGTILVDPDKNLAHWGLNSINSTNDATQHGEVRAITSYLDSLKSFNLKGFTLYTTLEPCAMCSGMATMTSIERVVYGQKDVDFSGALDRLAINSQEFGGFKPYPRTVISDPAPTRFRKELEAAFNYFLENEEEKYLAKFLTSRKANEIFSEARTAFYQYKVKFKENRKHYEKAKFFLERINI